MNDTKAKSSKKSVSSRIALIIFLALVIMILFAGWRCFRFAQQVKSCANDMKADVKSIVSCVLEQDLDGMDRSLEQFDRDTADMEAYLGSRLGRLAARIPGLRTEIASANRLVALAAEASETLLRPFASLQREYPMSNLKLDDGYNVKLILAYLDFAETHMPDVENMIVSLSDLDLGVFDRGNKLAEYKEKLEPLLGVYQGYERYIPLVRAFLGTGEDKLYFFAAQNSSEIRSSGGFPGSVGTVTIQDGILRIGDFGTVTGVLAFYNSADVNITHTERIIFNTWMNNGPRDADFSPDFERVAEIWAIGYRDQNGVMPDGVISATPAIIQRLLGVLGEIELSDGSVLNGDNAVKVLEYDLYYRYMGAGDNIQRGNAVTDALFAETVEKLMEKLNFSGNISQAIQLASVLEESAADRTLMLWFPDPEKQQLVRDLGLAATLNYDSSKPEAGVYFSLSDPGRMGWFLNMDAGAELLETRDDGSKVYDVTVTLSNVMTQEEYNNASFYIRGSRSPGNVFGFLYLFAPAGGTVSEVESSDPQTHFEAAEYRGLDLQYTLWIRVRMGETLTLHYTVTTAPGEQEDLCFSMTPTLQNFR